MTKTILITGATSGFGLVTAKLLAGDGHRLILVARRKERLDELKKALKTDVFTAVVDVTDKGQVQKFFDSLPEEFQHIDVLLNNAGLVQGMDPAQEAKLEDWDKMVDTNIKGLLYVLRPTVETMKRQGSGLIINVGSVAAHVPYKGGNVYGATKAFVRQLSRNLRVDLFGTGVRVTNLEPGAAETEFAGVRFKDQQKGAEYYKGWKPLTAEDVARTIVWIINQPPHVNVENIEIMPLDQVNGGMITNKR
jgi:3-hydroxy acid dehydrogenase / malonic semialdehyde reductase